MNVSLDINLNNDEVNELALVLNSDKSELTQRLSIFGTASLHEYITMFLGQKVFRRGSDILEYRLFLLIESALEGQIPDEQEVSNLFQTTLNESRSLIRSVMSKYQYQLRDAIENSIRSILKNATNENKGEYYVVVVNSINLIAEMNSVIAGINGNLPPITKKRGGISTYIIQPSSFSELNKKYATGDK